jgi:D-alanine transaminase
MSRIVYVNGRYLPHRQAQVHFEDRGYQFADGVYEVCEIRGGHIVDETRHLDRLDRSLRELRIAAPMKRESLALILREVIRRNRVRDGIVYLQVTRGVAPRDHGFPASDVAPALLVSARANDPSRLAGHALRGVAVVSVPETRWQRVDIKSVALLPNVLAKQAAREQGAYEAWFVDANGMVREGASTNAWIITAEGVLCTHPTGQAILAGVTRATLIEQLHQAGLRFEERAFSLIEAKAAREAFITSATSILLPVIRLDGEPIGDGRPGPLTLRLRAAFHDTAEMHPLEGATHRPSVALDAPSNGKKGLAGTPAEASNAGH